MGQQFARPSGSNVVLLKERGNGHGCDCQTPNIDMNMRMPDLLIEAGIRESDYLAMLNSVNHALRDHSPNVKAYYFFWILNLISGQFFNIVRPENVKLWVLIAVTSAPGVFILLSVFLYIHRLMKKNEMVNKELSKITLDHATLCYAMPTKHAEGGVFVTIDENHLQMRTIEEQSLEETLDN